MIFRCFQCWQTVVPGTVSPQGTLLGVLVGAQPRNHFLIGLVLGEVLQEAVLQVIKQCSINLKITLFLIGNQNIKLNIIHFVLQFCNILSQSNIIPIDLKQDKQFTLQSVFAVKGSSHLRSTYPRYSRGKLNQTYSSFAPPHKIVSVNTIIPLNFLLYRRPFGMLCFTRMILVFFFWFKAIMELNKGLLGVALVRRMGTIRIEALEEVQQLEILLPMM